MAPITRICRTAPAKLNLALHVRAKRPEGWHELDSVFVHTVDGDELWVEPAEELSLTVSGPFGAGLSSGEDNLVLRTARAVHEGFARDEPRVFTEEVIHEPDEDDPFPAWIESREVLRLHHGASRGAAIHLVKNLPLASGIGGGSADAAAAIELLVALWELPDDVDKLTAIAATLGADVAPCLFPWPKHVRGRGEHFVPLSDPALRGWPVVLVNPGVQLSTGEVFAGWDGVDCGGLGEAPGFAGVVEFGRNDLEAPARALAPAIGEAIDALAAQPGAFGARMSGSGATCFALFGSAAEAGAAAAAIRAARPDWWVMASRLA